MTTHVIGAGLAGLAAALAARGRVVVHEAAPLAGGRARALADGLDNGTHALVGANRAALGFLREIGARDGWVEPEPGGLPVLDMADGRARRVALSPLGWWRKDRRPDGAGVQALGALMRLAGPGDVAVAGAMAAHPAFLRGFVEPLVIAALNTPVAEASSRKLGAVLRRVGAPGAARLLVARRGLGPDLVEPALAALRARGVEIRNGARLRGLQKGRDGRVIALEFADGTLALGDGDSVILALPPWEAGRLLPEISVPAAHAPILNLHFDHKTQGPVRFLGVLGGLCQWVLVRPDTVAVTVSAADAEARESAEDLTPRAWAEIRALAAAFHLPGAWPEVPPPCRAVKEKRATPRHRPGDPPPPPVRVLPNLALAGDWMEPVLPATIDAAVRSGRRAARALAG
ncbi:hydroxysqualene dehydroxylase [Pararoseomonas indoligenes]|uniref:FAD-dependent oxidoreductase n=1 Tax=Roseomonas indoligenes TaxID=2820811 RepID=A0A940MZ87_9PROT|nr:FAD-dependent oxidoreductase [Pararoseomonas indoligenes]MBP0494901.1 FAD-dependent oxidoreductase [Pararoseomonas indoligenes]